MFVGDNPMLRWLQLAVLVVSASIVVPVHADTGELRVATEKVDGRPLAGASIVVESRSGDLSRATTGADGVVSIGGLEAGLYRVTASLDGYVSVVEPSFRVVRDKTVPLRLPMRVADETVDEILVVAKAVQTDPFGAITTTYLGREDLRTAVGSGADVLRALDGLPGLVSTGDFASFTVRGRGPRDNLILVDGIPYDKVVHFDQSLGEQEDINGGGRFSVFPPTLIDGAEFSPGGWSAAYGGRNGSLLMLDVARGNPSPSASLRVDLAGVEAIYDGPSGFHDDTSLIFTARHFNFGQLFDIIDEKSIGEPVLTDVILKTHPKLNDSNELEFLALYTPEDYTRDVENVLASDNLQERELVKTEQDASLLAVTWARLFGDDGRWENRLYVRDTEKTSSEGVSVFRAGRRAGRPGACPREHIYAGRERVRDRLAQRSVTEQSLGRFFRRCTRRGTRSRLFDDADGRLDSVPVRQQRFPAGPCTALHCPDAREHERGVLPQRTAVCRLRRAGLHGRAVGRSYRAALRVRRLFR